MEEQCRIMIVDDEYIMRQGIRYMLDWEKEGYVVTGEASNGKEALDMLEAASPHIILCDIAMPVMDGLDFIKIVRREYPDIQIIVLSSYDKFDYVRQALLNGAADYVLKPTLNPEELLKIVVRAARKIPGLKVKPRDESDLETQIEYFLTGYDTSLNSRELQKIFHESCYRLLVIPLRRQDNSSTDLSSVLYDKIESLLKGQQYGNYLKFLMNQETLCIILNYGLKDEKRLLDFLENLMEQLSALYEKIFGILSPERKKIEELKEDFSAEGFMEEEIFYNRGVHLYLWEEKESKLPLEKFDFRRFVGYLGEHKYQEALDLFHQYMQCAVQCKVPEFKLKNQTKNLLYNIISTSDDQVQELEKIRREYFRQIDQAPYCEEFLETVQDAENRLKSVLIQKQKQDFYLQEILEFIRKHYKEELDLQGLAEEFNFNYSYLSAYFNSHVGEGFSEYLNRVRIEKACDYLEKREYSIAQVSSMVGYSDHSYFCRVFKKITGRTPSVYRRERRKES